MAYCEPQEVIGAARQRADALARADGETLRNLLHEKFHWTTHLGATYDREEYIRRNTEGDTVWRTQDLGDPAVVVVGDTAVLRTQMIDVPVTQVWVRQDDAWRCLGGHAGPRRT